MFSYKRTGLVAIIFTFLLSTVLILISYRRPESEEKTYILREYNGVVALYRGDEVLSVYDGIVLSAFPKSDRQKFIDGVPVGSPEEAEIMIEDYDG